MADIGLDVEAFRVLHPLEYYSSFIAQGVRPDGRVPTAFRLAAMQEGGRDCSALRRYHLVDLRHMVTFCERAPLMPCSSCCPPRTASLTTCDGSAIVRQGGTTVAVGVTVTRCTVSGTAVSPGETVMPRRSVPLAALAAGSRWRGSVSVSVALPPLAAPARVLEAAHGARGGTGATHDILGARMADMLEDLLAGPTSGVFAYWGHSSDSDAPAPQRAAAAPSSDAEALLSLVADLTFTSYDGNAEDACVLALAAALACTRIPERVRELGGSHDNSAGAARSQHLIPLARWPVASTFVTIRGQLVADPSAEEEELAEARVTVIVGVPLQRAAQLPGRAPSPLPLLAVRKLGARITAAQVEACVALANARAASIAAQLHSARGRHELSNNGLP
jgi:exosome complex RNA-binding protein Rrp42 (RNase PH superfamily)